MISPVVNLVERTASDSQRARVALRQLPPAISDDEELARLARALSHPARVRIVRILAQRGGCICGDIVNELPLAQSTVSQHLKVLEEAGFIAGAIDGPRICYCLKENALRRLRILTGAL
jgi:ArsR family transcriptional regulator, arsenate/arsenite/antimonite-responsive transcriptional repressor